MLVIFGVPALATAGLPCQHAKNTGQCQLSLVNGVAEPDQDGFVHESSLVLENNIIVDKYDKLDTPLVKVWSGTLDVHAELRMRDYEYLEKQGGTIKTPFLNASRLKGSGVRNYTENLDVSTLAFIQGGLNVDRMDVLVEAKKIFGQNYDSRAWGPEFHTGVSLSNYAGDGNAFINVLGVKSDSGEAVGAIYKFRGNQRLENINAEFSIQNVVGCGTYGSAAGFQLLGASGHPLNAHIKGEVHISNVYVLDSVDNSEAYGLYSGYDAGQIHFDKKVTIRNVALERGYVYGIMNDKKTTLEFNGGLEIVNDGSSAQESSGGKTQSKEYAIWNKHQIIINPERNVIQGDVVNEGFLKASFVGADSSFKGAVRQLYDAGTTLEFARGSQWIVTNDSSIRSLTLDGGALKLTENVLNNQVQRNVRLVADSVDSENGSAYLHMDLKNQENGSLITTGDASGTLNVCLAIENLDSAFKKSDFPLIVINNKNESTGTFEVGRITYQPGAAQKLELRFFEDGATDSQGTLVSHSNGKWYLVNPNPVVPPEPGEDPKPDPEKPPVTDEVDQVLSLGTSLTQSLGMLSETEDLRMRMGDVRHGERDGLWLRTYYRQDSARGSFGNGFKQDVHGFHIGADHAIGRNAGETWLVGGAFHYGRSDINGAAEAGGGDADIDQYTFKAYAYIYAGQWCIFRPGASRGVLRYHVDGT